MSISGRLRVQVRPGTDPTRTALLLCNGIGVGLELLDPFVAALDPAIEVIRFDAPGVGRSPQPPLPYTFPMLARLVTRLLDAHGHHRFDVLGLSWGGGLAQQLALQYPRRCRRLVLVSSTAGWTMWPAGPRVLLDLVVPGRDPGTLYGGSLRGRPDRVRQLVGEQGRPASARGLLYQFAAGAAWTSLPFLPLLRQPVLIVAGADDPLVPLVNARIMARLLPNARLHVHPDGHLGLLTRAAELAPLIADFLAEP